MRKIGFWTVILLLLFAAVPGWGETVAPGVEHEVYITADPNVVHVVRIDMMNHPEYKLRMGFPQKKRNYSSRETVMTIASRYENPPDFDVLAATNAGFFGSGIAINGILGDADCYVQQPSGAVSFGIGDSRIPFADSGMSYSNAVVTLADNSTMTIAAWNQARSPDSLACYADIWGPTTGTTEQGVEVVVSNVSYPIRADKEVSGVITEIRTGSSSVNSPIPAGGLVLSAVGTAAATLQSRASVGSRVRILADIIESDASKFFNHSRFSCAGQGWILRNGVQVDFYNPDNSFTWRHPRTVLAWNATHLFMATVDGRQPGYSVGMTFDEMAAFFKNTLQCTDCVNLDGGGSTTMVVNGTLVNRPSDATGPRAVANAVLLVRQDTQTRTALSDDFTSAGRSLPWDDKLRYCGVSAMSPAAPGGDGYVMTVMNPSGGFNTTHVGDLADRNYSVEAYVYCEYRNNVSSNGYERSGIFARDNGNFAFVSSSYNSGNCYVMTYDSNNGRVRAGKVVNGVLTDFLDSNRIFRTSTAWRKFKIRCIDNNIQYSLDNVVIAVVTDNTFSRGFCGVGYHEYFSTNSNMHGARVDTFRFNLEPATGTLTGKVTFSSNGQAVAGALVENDRGGKTTTDTQGNYSFTDIYYGSIRVRAQMDGWAPTSPLSATVPLYGTATVNLVIDDVTPAKRNKLYTVFRTYSPPVIDGVLSPEEWNYYPQLSPFYAFTKGDIPADPQTTACAVWDDKNLYAAFEVMESDMAHLTASATGRDNEAIFQDDEVEIHLDPLHRHGGFDGGEWTYQIGINSLPYPSTAVTDLREYANPWTKDLAFNFPGLTAAATRGTDRWYVEVKIPLAEIPGMSVPPVVGKVFGMLFGRGRPASHGDGKDSWSAGNITMTSWRDATQWNDAVLSGEIVHRYTTPAGYLSEGWNLVSVPADPVNPDPLVVFSDISVPDSSFQFWCNERDGGGYQGYGSLYGWTGPIVRGIPYWFIENEPDRFVSYVGTPSETVFDLVIPPHSNAPFWIAFGTPYPLPVPTDSVRFRNINKRGDVWLNWVEAFSPTDASLRIIDSNAQGWANSVHGFVGVTPSIWPGRHEFDPWWGYWLLVYDRNEMIIRFPKP